MQLFVAFIVWKLQFEVGSDVRWQFTLGLWEEEDGCPEYKGRGATDALLLCAT